MSKTLKDGGTSTTAGGTDQIMEQSGETVANGVVLVESAVADYFTRPKLYMVNRMPSQGSDGIWSKQKGSVRYVVPKVLADGVTTVFNLVRFEIEIHPESTAAELADLREKGAQIGIDAEFDDFFSVGSLD